MQNDCKDRAPLSFFMAPKNSTKPKIAGILVRNFLSLFLYQETHSWNKHFNKIQTYKTPMNDTKACAHTFICPGHNQLLKCLTKKVIGYTIITSTKVVNSFYIQYAARIQYITYFTLCLVSIISTSTCYVKILWSITEIQFPSQHHCTRFLLCARINPSVHVQHIPKSLYQHS